jgi:hypothetical protein
VSRPLSEKGWVPIRYWALWWSLLAIAVPLFYVVMAPIWIAIRLAAWVAELRARAQAA